MRSFNDMICDDIYELWLVNQFIGTAMRIEVIQCNGQSLHWNLLYIMQKNTSFDWQSKNWSQIPYYKEHI